MAQLAPERAKYDQHMKRFVETVQKSEELQNELQALEGKDDIFERQIAIANEHGFVLTMEDFDVGIGDDTELSLNNLDAAVGGVGWRDRHADPITHAMQMM